MTIRSKFLIFAFCVSLIPISIITALYYFNARGTIEKQTLSWLTAVAESKKTHTLSFLDSKKGRVIDFGSDGFIRDSLELVSVRGLQSGACTRLIKHLKQNKKTLDSQLTSIAVLDIKGMVVASTTDEWVGMDMSSEDIFRSCVTKNYGESYTGKSYSYSTPFLSVDCIFISSPLTDKHDNKTIGVIVNAYDIAILDEITTKRAGMGETGEALLGQKSADKLLFLTTLKYAPGMPRRISVPLSSTGSEPMRLALNGKNGTIIAHDYRGKDVVAAYQYIPDLEWGLVTKLDKEEVFSPITNLRIFTIAISIICAIVVIVISIILVRRVTKPLQKLAEGTHKISEGDLNFKLTIESKDEIGLLANSFNDMTSQLDESNARLEGYSHNLELMVADKTKEIEQMLEELRYKNKEMEQIVYVASHDLRSPLLNIQGFSKELQSAVEQIRTILDESDMSVETREKFAEPLEEDIPDALRFILTSSSKMDALLSGLLHVSRLGRARLSIKELDMNKLVSDITETFKYQIKEANVKFPINELPSCRGDEVKINQVFSNLLDNALKYRDRKRDCIITLSGKREDGHVVYCLEDNGLGIAEKHMEKIFEIFHRLHPADSDVVGEGLGLSIVRRIIDRHGGKIWVESEPGKGSKFYVSLPE